MPPTNALTFVSRYALDVTVPGTLTPSAAGAVCTASSLIPARSIASGVRDTSTISSGLTPGDARVSPGMGIPAIDFVVPEGDFSADDVRRSLQTTPAATPSAMRRSPVTTCLSRRRPGLRSRGRDANLPGSMRSTSSPCITVRSRRRRARLPRPRRELQAALGGSDAGLGGGDVALVQIEHREHDRHAAAEVMERVLDRTGLA